MQLLVEFYEIIGLESQFLTDEARARVPQLGRELLMLYAQLAAEARANNRKLWKFSPKHHAFGHLCEDQAPHYGNPRWYWCYMDEDLVGKLIEVAHSCHPSTMATTSLFKYGLFVFDA